MSPSRLPRLCRRSNLFTSSLQHHASKPRIRFSSNTSKPSTLPIPSTTTTPLPSPQRARIQRLHSRLPSFLHPYTRPLLDAPKTYIVSFLILHEITAVLPLFALAGTFHYTQWVPSDYIESESIRNGVRKFEKYFARKGWFGYGGVKGGSEIQEHENEVGLRETGNLERKEEDGREQNWRGKRIVLEVATAYAITKVLLPARIVVCVWGMPWFARVVGKVGGLVRRVSRGS